MRAAGHTLTLAELLAEVGGQADPDRVPVYLDDGVEVTTVLSAQASSDDSVFLGRTVEGEELLLTLIDLVMDAGTLREARGAARDMADEIGYDVDARGR